MKKLGCQILCVPCLLIEALTSSEDHRTENVSDKCPMTKNITHKARQTYVLCKNYEQHAEFIEKSFFPEDSKGTKSLPHRRPHKMLAICATSQSNAALRFKGAVESR